MSILGILLPRMRNFNISGIYMFSSCTTYLAGDLYSVPDYSIWCSGGMVQVNKAGFLLIRIF